MKTTIKNHSIQKATFFFYRRFRMRRSSLLHRNQELNSDRSIKWLWGLRRFFSVDFNAGFDVSIRLSPSIFSTDPRRSTDLCPSYTLLSCTSRGVIYYRLLLFLLLFFIENSMKMRMICAHGGTLRLCRWPLPVWRCPPPYTQTYSNDGPLSTISQGDAAIR